MPPGVTFKVRLSWLFPWPFVHAGIQLNSLLPRCEMIRPHVQHSSENPWGGFDTFTLRVAGLARAVQSRLYLHSCSLRYCLLNRSSCRTSLGVPGMVFSSECFEHCSLNCVVNDDARWQHRFFLPLARAEIPMLLQQYRSVFFSFIAGLTWPFYILQKHYD